jgi:hypothetical protein
VGTGLVGVYYHVVVALSSEQHRIRFVGDIDREPEPLRSQLWALVMAGASELDDDEVGGAPGDERPAPASSR